MDSERTKDFKIQYSTMSDFLEISDYTRCMRLLAINLSHVSESDLRALIINVIGGDIAEYVIQLRRDLNK